MLALLRALLQLTLDLLRQTLTKLDTPLIERIDIPNRTLGKGQMLIIDNQGAESSGRDLIRENGCRGTITQEGLVLEEFLGGILSLQLSLVFADHEGFSLSEEVGCEHLLVLVVVDGVVGLGGQDEVCGDELGALVEQLVERVLGVGGGFAEEDWSCSVFDELVGAARDSFPVGFHGELLEVGGETVEVLVESGGVSLSFQELQSEA